MLACVWMHPVGYFIDTMLYGPCKIMETELCEHGWELGDGSVRKENHSNVKATKLSESKS